MRPLAVMFAETIGSTYDRLMKVLPYFGRILSRRGSQNEAIPACNST